VSTVDRTIVGGCPAMQGVRGIGVVNAVEVVHAFPGLAGLLDFKAWVASPDTERIAAAAAGGPAAATATAAAARRGGDGGDASPPSGSESDGDDNDGDQGGGAEPKVPDGGKEEGAVFGGGAAGGVGSSGAVGSGGGKSRRLSASERRTRREFQATHRGMRGGWHLPGSFPSQAVLDAYLSPHVDRSRKAFSWGRPDAQLLRLFCGCGGCRRDHGGDTAYFGMLFPCFVVAVGVLSSAYTLMRWRCADGCRGC
jgi:DNA excision repair protein ERCC-5